MRYCRRSFDIGVSLLLIIAVATPALAKVPQALADKVDPIFTRWNSTERPGYAVGVIQNGALIFARGYGMANLEYTVPITPDSPF